MTISCTIEGLSRSGPSESSDRGVTLRPSGAAGNDPLDDRVLRGPAGQLRPAADARLVAHTRQVRLHRAGRDVQLSADLVVGHAVGHEAQDLELALSELGARSGRRL